MPDILTKLRAGDPLTEQEREDVVAALEQLDAIWAMKIPAATIAMLHRMNAGGNEPLPFPTLFFHAGQLTVDDVRRGRMLARRLGLLSKGESDA